MQTATKAIFLLSAVAAVTVQTSSASFQSGSQGRVMWDNNCDFYGQDTYSVRAIPDACGDLCANDGGCTHWTWTDYNGGTCWLKNGNSATQGTYYGAGCGYVIGRFGSSSAQQQGSGGSVSNGLSVVESQAMLNSINAYRNQNGLASLQQNDKLHAASMSHSQDQANTCRMSHDGSDGSQPWDRMSAAGYTWSNAAENVAAGQTSVDTVMTSWWNSAGHRANILNAEVRDVGFAKAVNNGCGNYKTYWTQDFGKSA